jgi:hypothetical protein
MSLDVTTISSADRAPLRASVSPEIHERRVIAPVVSGCNGALIALHAWTVALGARANLVMIT